MEGIRGTPFSPPQSPAQSTIPFKGFRVLGPPWDAFIWEEGLQKRVPEDLMLTFRASIGSRCACRCEGVYGLTHLRCASQTPPCEEGRDSTRCPDICSRCTIVR
eukprot:9490781-Pyramimonas_sp.AAC.1